MKRPVWIVVVVIIAAVVVLLLKGQARKEDPASEPAVAPAGESTVVSSDASIKEGVVLTGADLGTSLKSGRPTLAEFGKGTCEICQKMVPVLEQAAEDYAGEVNIVSVDLDDYAGMGHFYHIVTMPTQIFFDTSGEEVERNMGFMPREEIDAALARLDEAND